jgi:hypothetical protein
MRAMTRMILLTLSLLAVPLGQAQIREAQPVYFWPMQYALDQYLAEAVNTAGVLTVTFDPKLAGAIMTERIDSNFLEAMEELFPANKEAKDESGKKNDSIEGDFAIARTKNRPQARPQGTLFLVDVKTRRVIWSSYRGELKPDSKDLHKEARRVVEEIAAAVNPAS